MMVVIISMLVIVWAGANVYFKSRKLKKEYSGKEHNFDRLETIGIVIIMIGVCSISTLLIAWIK